MDQTAIKAGMPPSTGVNTAITADRPKPQVKAKSPLVRCLETVASLRITVVLFALSMVLVYYGTWAQKESGIWTVVNQYFRSALVWIPMKVVLMHSVDDIGGSIPFPGGWLLGGLLLVNLLAAHAIRFKISWKRSGILLIHAGLILMMLGELVAGLFSIEGHMIIMEGNSANFVEHDRFAELAVVERTDPTVDKEVVIPGKLLARGGTIEHGDLPFDVHVVQYMPNSDLLDFGWREPGKALPDNIATTGIGLRKIAKPRGEASGVETEQKAERASAYVTLKEKGTGKPLGTYLLSTQFSYLQKPLDELVINGKRYGFALRFERDYRNYAIQLLKFSHDKYIGTEKAKNYSSEVVVKDPNEDKPGRPFKIYMNHPLSIQGETFYQADLAGLAKGTVLQAVRNPGWWMPYISCLLVSGGMLVHFGLNLIGFLQRRYSI